MPKSLPAKLVKGIEGAERTDDSGATGQIELEFLSSYTGRDLPYNSQHKATFFIDFHRKKVKRYTWL